MKDHKPHVEHFRFWPGPQHAQAGIHGTPFMGDVEVGRIYPVTNPMVIGILEEHEEWESVTKKDYDAQSKADKKEQQDDEE